MQRFFDTEFFFIDNCIHELFHFDTDFITFRLIDDIKNVGVGCI